MKKIVQTAGRDQLGEFAPQFARLNDAALVFAENLLMLSAFACLGVILSLAVKRKKTA